MDKLVSSKTSLKLAGGFGIKRTWEDLAVTQYNRSDVNEFALLNIKKASNKVDKKALNVFNVFVQSS